jgi:ABC-type sugar transport system ATPase subunit
MSIIHNTSLASLKSVFSFGWLRHKPETDAAARDIEAFDIKVQSPRQEVRKLSGGNQQKVVLAKWLRTRPKVLLLDEPTTGVDVGAKHEIYELMNRWTSSGMGILLITSELPELLAMSDRIITLHRGRISAEFRREQATQEKIIQAAMGEGRTH